MFLRFVTDWTDEDSGEAAGLFLAEEWAQGHADPREVDLARLAVLRLWFNRHLKRPRRFRRSRRPHRRNRALSWFKDSAREHITHAREMVAILSASGVAIREIRTDRPGYIVYEDDHQVVAEPFAETRR